MRCSLLVFLVFYLLLSACQNSEYSSAASDDKTAYLSSKKTPSNRCTQERVLLLQNRKTLQSLFQSTDLWYQNHTSTSGKIFSELNIGDLQDFFSSIDFRIFKIKNTFSKEYHFDKAPKDFVDSEECLDEISLSYLGDDLAKKVAARAGAKDVNVNCIFMLSVFSSFFVKDFGCTEQKSFYYFNIENELVQIIDIDRAG